MLSMDHCLIASVIVLIITYWVYLLWKPRNKNVRVPPGSMGLPFIGETIQFIMPSKSIDMPVFVKSRIKKYGPIFKTKLVGRPIVISSDVEFNSYILQQDGKLVEFWYLDSFNNVLDQAGLLKDGLGAVNVHKYLKKMIWEHVGHDFLRGKLLPKIQETVQNTLHSWTRMDSVEVKRGLAKMTSEFTANALFGYEAEQSEEELCDLLSTLLKGLLTVPLNIPGTPYHNAIQAKDKILKMVLDTINERRANPEKKRREDLVDHLMDDMKSHSFLSHEIIAYAALAVVLAAVETVPTNLALAIKLVNDHPSVMQEILKENNQIFGGKEHAEAGVSWNDFKSMTFTMHVIHETLRMGSSAMMFRRAIEDIQINGYTIPKGWTIIVVSAAQHMNADFYKEPLTFDPWRWKDGQVDVSAKSFIAFGGGVMSCVGADFGKVFMAFFLHQLVTKYRWTKVEGGEIVRAPTLSFKNGYHIKIYERTKDVTK